MQFAHGPSWVLPNWQAQKYLEAFLLIGIKKRRYSSREGLRFLMMMLPSIEHHLFLNPYFFLSQNKSVRALPRFTIFGQPSRCKQSTFNTTPQGMHALGCACTPACACQCVRPSLVWCIPCSSRRQRCQDRHRSHSGPANTAPTLFRANTSSCQHFLVQTLLRANTSSCQHFFVPTLLSANTS